MKALSSSVVVGILLLACLASAAEVRGSLSKEEIQETIRKGKTSVSRCYDRARKDAPDLRGKVAAKFVIDGSGKVVEAAVAENTTGNDDLASCVVDSVKQLRFPEPKGGGKVVVTYPWNFQPSPAKK